MHAREGLTAISYWMSGLTRQMTCTRVPSSSPLRGLAPGEPLKLSSRPMPGEDASIDVSPLAVAGVPSPTDARMLPEGPGDHASRGPDRTASGVDCRVRDVITPPRASAAEPRAPRGRCLAMPHVEKASRASPVLW